MNAPGEAQGRYSPPIESGADHHVGRILGIALRTSRRQPMSLVDQATAQANCGLIGDHGSSTRRGLTLIASDQWRQVTEELGATIPWHRRRANILVEAASLAELIDQQIQIGPARVHILAETEPCVEMERAHPGLLAALVPDCRGGVYGRILKGGQIRVGDSVIRGTPRRGTR